MLNKIIANADEMRCEALRQRFDDPMKQLKTNQRLT